MQSARKDVCVSGNGAVAMTLALALSAQGFSVAWACEPQGQPGQSGQPSDFASQRGPDVRTYALNRRAVELLERLKIWPSLRSHAQPVHEMAVAGDAGATLSFSAWQQTVGELAWIVDAAALEQLLAQALQFAPRVDRIGPQSLEGLQAQAQVLAVCEGKHSGTRAQLGVEVRRRDYPQTAVAARLLASRPHAGVARQWFRGSDILALLPFHDLQGQAAYGLVWSLPRADAAAAMAMDAAGFEQHLMSAVQASDAQAAALVGELRLCGEHGERASWPLSLAISERWVGRSWVLLGDAAHQVHPLAGQGLNLGLADVETLVDVWVRAREREPWRSMGDERVLKRYVHRRWLPTQRMATLTDALQTVFADERAPLKFLRDVGMRCVEHAGPLKRWLVSQALDAA